MKRLIKKIILLPYKAFNKVYNKIVFKLMGAKFSEFPKINGRIIIRGKNIRFGKNVVINSSYTKNPVGINSRTMFYVLKSGKIEIGDNVGISSSLFYAMNYIKIEENVLIGGGCQILDSDFHPLDYEQRIKGENDNTKSAAIIIKEGAFIGTSSIILKGVTIGERSIIAAGSVVSKSVPDREIWGGNPAKFIKKIS